MHQWMLIMRMRMITASKIIEVYISDNGHIIICVYVGKQP